MKKHGVTSVRLMGFDLGTLVKNSVVLVIMHTKFPTSNPRETVFFTYLKILYNFF